MCDEKKLESPAESTAKDKVRAGVNAAVAAVPIVGGSAVEIMNAIVTPSRDRRVADWMDQITDMVNGLPDSEGIATIDRLQNDERFVSVLMSATSQAIQTHDQEKLEMFKNAVRNTAIGTGNKEIMDAMLLNNISQLTIIHLKILVYVDNPAPGSARKVLLGCFPELNGSRELLDQIWADLFSKGFVNQPDLAMAFDPGSQMSQITTDLGKKMIGFVQ